MKVGHSMRLIEEKMTLDHFEIHPLWSLAWESLNFGKSGIAPKPMPFGKPIFVNNE